MEHGEDAGVHGADQNNQPTADGGSQQVMVLLYGHSTAQQPAGNGVIVWALQPAGNGVIVWARQPAGNGVIVWARQPAGNGVIV